MNFNCFMKGTKLKCCVASYHISCTYIFQLFTSTNFARQLNLTELNHSNHESVRRKTFQKDALFLQATSTGHLKILSLFQYLKLQAKIETKKCLQSIYFCSKTGFLPPKSSFLHLFQAFGHRNPDSLIALGLEELGDIEV